MVYLEYIICKTYFPGIVSEMNLILTKDKPYWLCK